MAPGEPWNKPNASTCNTWAVMYLDSRGLVEWWPIGRWGPDPWSHVPFRLRTLHDQLTDSEFTGHDTLVRQSIIADPHQWERAGQAILAIASGVDRDELSDTNDLHITDREYEMAVAAHRAGLTSTGGERTGPPAGTGHRSADAVAARLDRLEQPATGPQGIEPPARAIEL